MFPSHHEVQQSISENVRNVESVLRLFGRESLDPEIQSLHKCFIHSVICEIKNVADLPLFVMVDTSTVLIIM